MLDKLRKLYDVMPIPAQETLIRIEGARRNKSRFGKGFEECLQSYLDRSLWDAARVLEYQKLCLEAYLSVVFRCPREEALERYAKHPVMTKREARQYFRKELTKRLGGLKSHTSGTTGTGLVFYTTRRSVQEQWSVWWRFRTWHGIPRDEWSCFFGAPKIVPLRQRKPPFWRENTPGKQLIFSNYHIDAANAPHYLEKLKSSGLKWIHGFPSSISLLAAFACEQGTRVPMKWVTTSAENLMPHQVKLIEQAFGVTPIQHYGQEEGVANISQCPRGKLHVDEDFSRLEFVKSGYGDNIYHITGTNFTNALFPLVRYDTGDLATLMEGESCDCGRPGRVVHSLDGRLNDYVVSKSGKYIGLLDHMFKDCINVRTVQVRQEKAGAITVLIVKGDAYGSKDEAQLRDQMKFVLGKEMDCEIRYVPEVPKAASGKHRLVVSSLRGNPTMEAGMGRAVKFHDMLAGDWEDKYKKKGFQSRLQILSDFLQPENLPGQYWMDAGCGTATLSRELARSGCRVCAVDASDSMIREARLLTSGTGLEANIEFGVVKTVEELPHPTGAFDGILCSSVVEYLDRPEAALREFNRLLKPGGMLIISAPNRFSLFRRLQNLIFKATSMVGFPWPSYLQYVKHQYLKSEFNQVLEETGFHPVSVGLTGFDRVPSLGHTKWFGTLYFFKAVKKGEGAGAPAP